MKMVMGGRVCVNINGTNRTYFKTHRGLWQGDPLSPLLFNLAANVLACMMDKAKKKGYIKALSGSKEFQRKIKGMGNGGKECKVSVWNEGNTPFLSCGIL
jgi:hypothetical protein